MTATFTHAVAGGDGDFENPRLPSPTSRSKRHAFNNLHIPTFFMKSPSPMPLPHPPARGPIPGFLDAPASVQKDNARAGSVRYRTRGTTSVGTQIQHTTFCAGDS